MKQSKKNEPSAQFIENALDFGEFISYGRSWDFVNELEKVKSEIDDLAKTGEAECAVSLYEVFLSGCYEKAEEIDDSGGNFGMFAQELFISWITARQKAGCSPDETVKHILRWMDNDDYGFCYDIERDVAQVLDRKGFLLFRKHFEDQFESAFAPFKDQKPKYIYDYPSEDALKAAWSEFKRYPGVYSYEDLMKYVPKKNTQQWHKKAVQEARSGSLSGFIEICVKTNEWEMLSERIDSAKHQDLETPESFESRVQKRWKKQISE